MLGKARKAQEAELQKHKVSQTSQRAEQMRSLVQEKKDINTATEQELSLVPQVRKNDIAAIMQRRTWKHFTN